MIIFSTELPTCSTTTQMYLHLNRSSQQTYMLLRITNFAILQTFINYVQTILDFFVTATELNQF